MSSSRLDVLKSIGECEKRGEFDRHVDPIDFSKVIKVDGNYHYTKKGFEKLKYSVEELFIVRPYTVYINKKVMKTEFFGREHLKGIDSAVLTCNHVFMFDCLAMRAAVKGHKLYTVAAPFNNMKGFLGEMMRAGGMMPLSDEPSGLKAFNTAVTKLLEDRNYLLVYPEQAMWWMYEKPRPYKDGAFYIAARHNVPVIPCFITFRPTGKTDEDGIPEKSFIVNILEPVYPDGEKTLRENVAYMKETSYNRCREKYESFYGIPLKYTCEAHL